MRTTPTAAFLMACGVMTACGVDPPPEQATTGPIAVHVAIARVRPFTEWFEAGGTVRARVVAVLSSRIVAPVVETAVAPGDHVRAGQALVRLDARQLDAARAGAEAALAAAEQATVAAEADARAADAALALAAASHARIARLMGRNAATQGELDAAVAALRGAEGRAAAAAARTQEAERAIDAAREGARAAAATASYAILAAPFDGIVTDKVADPGNLAMPGVPLVTVEDRRRFRLEVSVDSARASTVAVGSRVSISVAGLAAPLEGTVTEVAPSIDAIAHAFVVKIDLPSNSALRSGLFGRVRFRGVERSALLVPCSALVRHGQLTSVFIDDGGTARMRFVRAGEPAGDYVPILAGISEGERVLADPPAHLTDATAVMTAARSSSHERRP